MKELQPIIDARAALDAAFSPAGWGLHVLHEPPGYEVRVHGKQYAIGASAGLAILRAAHLVEGGAHENAYPTDLTIDSTGTADFRLDHQEGTAEAILTIRLRIADRDREGVRTFLRGMTHRDPVQVQITRTEG